MSLRISRESLPVLLLGVVFVLASILMPKTWHIEAVIPVGSVSSPEKNLIIARICCLLDGIWCLLIALTAWRWKRLSAASLIEPKHIEGNEIVSRKTASLILIAASVLGLILRLISLDSSFWLDEITPLTFYRDTSVFGLLTTYFSTNNHLLYTLLEKVAVTMFGEQEWAVRLPSVLFGVATVPIMYILTRTIAPRWISLSTALLTAVNYQLIFFSQNARGYTGHLFFTLAATLFLVRGLKKDKFVHWCLYCACMFFNLASIIASLSALIAHFVIGTVAAIVVQKRSGGGWALFRRIGCVTFLALLMVLHLYSIIFPQAYAVVQDTYHVQSTGFTLFSTEFLNELIRGFKFSNNPLILAAAIPGIAVVVAGVCALYRCSWVMLAALGLPEIFLALYLLKLGLSVSPRFFLLALPFALIVGALGLYDLVKRVLLKINQPKLLTPTFSLGILCVALVSVPTLLQYYKIPKQDFRGAVLYLREKPEKIYPLSLYTAREGFGYYANKNGMRLDNDYFDGRTLEKIDNVLKQHRLDQFYVVTTFPRALHLDHPELEALVEKHWVVDRVFPGSIGDGDITVWKPRK
ncbi:MAG TPA: glycosyltransferase family 39 protein [Drouetiella sp.]